MSDIASMLRAALAAADADPEMQALMKDPEALQAAFARAVEPVRTPAERVGYPKAYDTTVAMNTMMCPGLGYVVCPCCHQKMVRYSSSLNMEMIRDEESFLKFLVALCDPNCSGTGSFCAASRGEWRKMADAAWRRMFGH